MRNRLTVSFIVLSILLLLGAGVVRAFVLRDLIREQESAHLQQQSVLVSRVLEARQTSGGTIDRDFLSSLVAPDGRLEYVPAYGRSVVVQGERYDGSDGTDGDLAASTTLDQGTVTIRQSAEVVRDVLGRDLGSVLVLFLMIAVVAGAIGYVVSRVVSAPFQQLAAAAAALGRGRFDVDVPRTRIPEARAIGQALRTSAAQLEDRLRRERDFAEHASHVLRTPLTGLRLELEELSLRDDVPDDVRASAVRGLAGVDEMNAVAGELVELSRSGSLVAGAEMPLVDLATQLAQRWADRLAARDRVLTASADGDLSLTYTPGPVEHVLDLVLTDVVRRGTGAVRIVFWGLEGGHLRVKVCSEGRVADPEAGAAGPRRDQARAVVEALGGRLSGDDPAAGLEVLLPRR
ncbi:histidine kinase dimerization/phospho-acceptor domain-containing protein [Nocardioides sp. MAHUQ-72]|uniref:histidine kinase dimerization/phospho-acceptor domain-containing protein n=1 Tax=unclassified Nocardioides TaxID=2615069 RepID=UPI00360C3542